MSYEEQDFLFLRQDRTGDRKQEWKLILSDIYVQMLPKLHYKMKKGHKNRMLLTSNILRSYSDEMFLKRKTICREKKHAFLVFFFFSLKTRNSGVKMFSTVSSGVLDWMVLVKLFNLSIWSPGNGKWWGLSEKKNLWKEIQTKPSRQEHMWCCALFYITGYY